MTDHPEFPAPLPETEASEPRAPGFEPSADGSTARRRGMLHIGYSQTQVLPVSKSILRDTEGIVTPDRSPLSEAFKILRAQIFQRMRRGRWNSLAITCPRPIARKSLASVNLALSFAADFDKTVLLVEADLASPSFDTLFGFTGCRGLSDHLLDGTPLAELLINPGIDHLVVLPAGRPVINSAELLATEATGQLVEELKNRYAERFVLFDVPPLLPTADALSFLPKVDAVLLVVEEGETTRKDLVQCEALLKPFNLIGVALCESAPKHGSEAPRALARTARRGESTMAVR